MSALVLLDTQVYLESLNYDTDLLYISKSVSECLEFVNFVTKR